MRGNGDERRINFCLIQNEIVSDKVDDNVQHCVRTTTGKIAERLLIYPPCKRLVEKINDCKNYISCAE